MSARPSDAVTFSDLSRNPRAVAERARRLGRLRITHRDTQDFYLTAADREEERDENLVTAARVFAALARSESGERAVASALAEVFPWVRHQRCRGRVGGTVPPCSVEHPAMPGDAACRSAVGAGHDRQHRLRGDLATHRHNGRDMEQWEYEVTSGGRVRYVIDDDNRTVW